MNNALFTASAAQQHRAQLMDSARHARDFRRAKNARSLRLRGEKHAAVRSRPHGR